MSVVKNICKKFSHFELEVSDWTIDDLKATVLWGSSGSGKTSIVRALAGIDTSMSLVWNREGRDLAQLPPHKRNLGVVLQHFGLFPHLTAQENIFFPIEAQRLDKKEAHLSFNKWVEVLNLKSVLASKAHVLSGGEQQRVALARALITKPQYLILDEPFSALDFDLKRSARELLKSVLKVEKIGALLVTHDKEDVAALAQHVVILQKGRIIATQTAEEFLKRM